MKIKNSKVLKIGNYCSKKDFTRSLIKNNNPRIKSIETPLYLDLID